MDNTADWGTHCLAMPRACLCARKLSVVSWNVRQPHESPNEMAYIMTSKSPVSEKTKNLQPIEPHALSVSPDGHVLLALETHARAGPGGGGRDLLAWGTNYDYQVGNGKRASIAVPTTLEREEGDRIMLTKRRAKVVRDLRGRVWRRGVEVEQVAIAGYGNSLVYWRIA